MEGGHIESVGHHESIMVYTGIEPVKVVFFFRMEPPGVWIIGVMGKKM